MILSFIAQVPLQKPKIPFQTRTRLSRILVISFPSLKSTIILNREAFRQLLNSCYVFEFLILSHATLISQKKITL